MKCPRTLSCGMLALMGSLVDVRSLNYCVESPAVQVILQEVAAHP